MSTCTACGSSNTRKHCDGPQGRPTSPTCKWWVCVRCSSFGDDRKVFDAQPKETR